VTQDEWFAPRCADCVRRLHEAVVEAKENSVLMRTALPARPKALLDAA